MNYGTDDASKPKLRYEFTLSYVALSTAAVLSGAWALACLLCAVVVLLFFELMKG